mmetsp:Transcript_23440/g.55541  ORF Transcript_23440/g.55541 Transcript_23440/m.55541 type:complete len:380 (-) Transcript_23440:240-1379(-)
MRFKAKMRNDQLSVLLSVIAPMSRLQDHHHHDRSSSSSSRFAVMCLDEDFVRVSCKQTTCNASDGSGITCFAELTKTQLFMDHRIESASGNLIIFQVDLESLKLALQSVVYQSRNSAAAMSNMGGMGGMGGGKTTNQRRNSAGGGGGPPNTNAAPSAAAAAAMMSNQYPDVVMKLAKRNNVPCLCLEGGTVRGMNGSLVDSVEIHQAIPIRILRRGEMQHHLPPHITQPKVQLELPNDRPIRPVIERLKAMGKHVILEGTMKGELTVRLDNDGASMACFYHNLIPRWDDEEEENIDIVVNDDVGGNGRRNPNVVCRLKVDAHRLSTCLQWQQHQLPMTSCMLGMVENEMLVLHVLLYPEQMGFFTYYLPVQLLEEEDQY